ncbi:helix-turn-helix domain-containing protein [Raoultibacter phocaeensis]|uniref:helix-turn-helix domain-containing protein n=1 Tax=Raoultibacter phocaeensis TaxID=2479841 RepID=UPI001117D9D3|nr:helix-turn-helix domain-containing protein [Raoultibacter phocaeensis]
MNSEKTGSLIRRLRTEQGMTQKDLSDKLHVSDRAVSKWERGCGSPDVSLLQSLSDVLGVDVQSLLTGDLSPNDKDGGNMKRIRFYRCPTCGNVVTSTSAAEVSCCGRPLEQLEVKRSEKEHAISIEEVEDEYLVTVDHPMKKDHFVSFVACATDERLVLVRMYPEQAAQTRFPRMPWSTWYVCCTHHGLHVLSGKEMRSIAPMRSGE